MAPKKEQKPVEEQWEGPITFVTVHVQYVSSHDAVSPEALLPGSAQAKKLTALEETGSFSTTFKRPQSLQTLSWFLNDPLTIKLSQDQQIDVDLIEFAYGKSSLEKKLNDGNILVMVKCEYEVQVDENDNDNNQEQSSGLQMVPFQFLSDQEVKGSIIIEISNLVIDNIPQGLISASSFVQNQLKLGFAIKFCEGCVIENLTGVVEEEKYVKFEKTVRKYIPNNIVNKLRSDLDDDSSCQIEVCRFLPSNIAQQFQDPANNFYHAQISFDCAEDLLSPGEKQFQFNQNLNQQFDSERDISHISILEKPSTPNPKSKIIEQPPQSGQCQFIESGSKISMNVNFSDSLYPPWQPPPKPSKSLQELIPPKPEPKKPAPTSEELFRSHVKSTISHLNGILTGQIQKYESEGLDQKEIKKHCIFDLNKSGEYLRAKTGLKKYVLDMMNASHLQIEDLYVRMFEHVQSVSNEPQTDDQKVQPENEHQTENHLEILANECQIIQEFERCEKIHQKRIVLYPRSVQAWYGYGKFCVKQGELERGEEALREVIAISPTHYDALLTLSCVLYHKGIFTDSIYFDECLVILQALQNGRENEPIIWAILTMVYKSFGDGSYSQEVRNCSHKVKLLGKELLTQEKQGVQCNGFAQIAEFCLDLNLSDCANKATKLALQMKELTESANFGITLIQARSECQLENYENAIKILKQVFEETLLDTVLLRAEINYTSGNKQVAVKDYENILHQIQQNKKTNNDDNFKCPLEVYWRLGTWYLHQNEAQYACDVFSNGCITHAYSSSMWLGVGRANIILKNLDDAEFCLTQANNADVSNPEVWIYLALLNVIEDRWEECRMSIKYGIREGLKDLGVLVQIAGTLLDRGRYPQAEEVLRQSLCVQNQKLEDVNNVRLLLASCFQEQSEFQSAIKQYQFVLNGEKQPSGEILGKTLTGLAAAHRAIGNMEQAEQLELEIQKI